MPVQDTVSSWEKLLEVAQKNTSARRVRRPGQSPSTAPIPSSLHKLPPNTAPTILLYRDTNSWCPFCERVWFALEEKGIPFETEFIDLTNKPKWYTDLVPTTLVPAAKIEGKLVYESKDILYALEEQFGDSPLLPENPEENAVARQLIEDAETSGFLGIAYKFLRESTSDANELANLQAAFEAKLDELEQTFGKYPGSYFVSTFSLVDIMYSPHLDRLAANLPVYRAEAAERLSDNREVAIADILKNSGVQALAIDGDISAIKEAIDLHLRLLADYLLNGNNIRLPWGRVGGKDNADPIVAAVGAIALAYVRNRICAPRDMSAGAATAFRAAADKVLASLY